MLWGTQVETLFCDWSPNLIVQLPKSRLSSRTSSSVCGVASKRSGSGLGTPGTGYDPAFAVWEAPEEIWQQRRVRESANLGPANKTKTAEPRRRMRGLGGAAHKPICQGRSGESVIHNGAVAVVNHRSAEAEVIVRGPVAGGTGTATLKQVELR